MNGAAWIIAELDGSLVGLAANTVLGVINPPTVTPIPFAPDFVDGLIGAGGDVVPLIDLGRRLGELRMAVRGEAMRGEAVRMWAAGQGFALGVDRVLALAQLGLDDGIEPAGADDRIVGIWNWKGRPVRLLDAARLGLDDTPPSVAGESAPGMVGQAVPAVDTTSEAATVAVMVFEQAGERFSLPLDHVHEVMEVASWSAVPQAAPSVLGLAFPRDKPLPLLSLARLIGRAPAGPPERQFIVAANTGVRFGLAVDRVIGIRRFTEKVESPFIATARGVDGHYLDETGAPIWALSLDRLIDDRLQSTFDTLIQATTEQAQGQPRAAHRQFLTFAVGEAACALPIESVERVVDYSQPVPLPAGGPTMIAGAVEIQGRVVPVAHAHRRIAAERGDDFVDAPGVPAAYVVLRLTEGPLALAVDRLHRILPIAVDRIEDFGAGAGAIAGVGRVGDRVLWILAAERLAPSAAGAAT